MRIYVMFSYSQEILRINFMSFCTVNCNKMAQHKPTKCTFVELIFYILRCFLHVSNPMVHLHESGYIYKYCIICSHVKDICSCPPSRWLRMSS